MSTQRGDGEAALGSEGTGQGAPCIVSMQAWRGDSTQLKGMWGAFAIAAARFSSHMATRVPYPLRTRRNGHDAR